MVRSRVFGFGVVIATIVVVGCSSSNSPTANQSAPVVTPPTAVIVVPTAGVVVPSPTPTSPPAVPAAVATATAVPKPLWVGNTDGQGVFLRRTPQLGDKLTAYVDGTPLQVVGPEVDGDGTHWQHVLTPDGTEGFIPALYALATQIPIPTRVPVTATEVAVGSTAVAVSASRTPVSGVQRTPTARPASIAPTPGIPARPPGYVGDPNPTWNRIADTGNSPAGCDGYCQWATSYRKLTSPLPCMQNNGYLTLPAGQTVFVLTFVLDRYGDAWIPLSLGGIGAPCLIRIQLSDYMDTQAKYIHS